MNNLEELEQVLTLDPAEDLANFDSGVAEASLPTQRLLDELLGRLEDDDAPTFRAQTLRPEFYADSCE